METPTICLNMIVKNEGQIITRLLDSVCLFIDNYCICDTGSTDDTKQIIENYFKNKNIPGKIIDEPFKNFSHNRNVALKECYGMSDYILLLDADMILDLKHFNKQSIKSADAHYILQGNDSFYYENIRIIKNNGLYKYVGVTHEYIDIPSGSIINHIQKPQLFINDISDGGCKSDKFTRDVELLLNGIQDEPNNERYYFYLANTYYDLGRYAEAIDYYKVRIQFGGWKEEVWYSYYKTGLCYKNLQDMKNASWAWMEGYEYYPERLEGLYELLHYYRIEGKNKLAMNVYNICKPILEKNANRDSYLFLHNDVYKFKIYLEYSIIAAYNGISNVNDAIVTLFNNASTEDVNNLLSNMKFYKFILNISKRFVLDNSIKLKDSEFVSSSSCLIKALDNDDYFLNVRYVNYKILENGSYDNGKQIVSLNRLVNLDKNFNVKHDNMISVDYDDRLYVGIEDIRLYYDKYIKVLLFIGTGLHKDNKIGLIYGDYMFSNITGIPLTKYSCELKQHFKETECEKNWVFVDYNGKTNIIYSWYPLTICDINENNTIAINEQKEMPKIFSYVRGSSCGYNYSKKCEENNDNISIQMSETEIWFVNHIVSYEKPRHYYHIISVFDQNMKLLRYSAPFKFEGEPIEYCLSIIVNDDQVFINYSTMDRTTRIGVYDKKYIDSILIY